MNHEAYLASLAFAKEAIDRKDLKRTKYWLEKCLDYFRWDATPSMPLLPNEYKDKALQLLTESCR